MGQLLLEQLSFTPKEVHNHIVPLVIYPPTVFVWLLKLSYFFRLNSSRY